MKRILDKKDNWISEFYTHNNFAENNYKLSKYTVIEHINDGVLLYHTITRAMYVLTDDEFLNILNNETLKNDFIIVDDKIDEDEIAKNVYIKRAQSPVPTFDKVNEYIIFTTHNCNAQCSYCFEQNNHMSTNNKNMSMEIAEKVVEYILKTRQSDNISLRWFGGEPLLNTKVIDYITSSLKNNEIYFTSFLTTNGLLLNETNIKKSIDLWNVKCLQITIDGIGEVYNNIKNYKNINFDAFTKVVNNIKQLLINNNIKIFIRTNVSTDNINNVEPVLEYFTTNFKEYVDNRRLKLYITPIYQLLKDDKEISNPIFTQIDDIRKKYNLNRIGRNTIKNGNLYYCMSDVGNTVVIGTNGDLTLCEHWNNDNIIGNIFDGITKPEIIKEWNDKTGDNISFCFEQKCKFLPICNHLKKCPSDVTCETTLRMKQKEKHFRKMILHTYKKYKNENGEE